MTREEFYKDFISWAIEKLKENFTALSVDNATLKICFFTDGEPFISGFPDLCYKNYLNDFKKLQNAKG